MRIALAIGTLFLFSNTSYADVILYGSEVFSNPNLTSIDKATGNSTFIGDVGSTREFNSLAISQDGSTLYSVGKPDLFGQYSLISIDSITATPTTIGTVTLPGETVITVTGLTIDESGQMFAMQNFTDSVLYKINQSNGAGTLVGDTGKSGFQSLASGDGKLWSFDGGGLGTDLGLVTIDKTTGAVTDVSGANGGGGLLIQGLTYADNGMLYGATLDNLYEIDPTNGAFQLIGGNFSDLRGMASHTAVPEPAAVFAAVFGMALFFRRRLSPEQTE